MSSLVSIVTVAYNSAATIQTTVESVLNQTYSHIEYIIVDGDSKDDTVRIAEGFRGRLEEKGITLRIISEPDKGIYDAMNKGIMLATGEIIGIINSDDWYEPHTVQTVVDTFQKEQCDLLFADIRVHKKDGSSFVKKARIRSFETSRDWNHPTMFVKSEVYKSHLFRMKGIHDDYGCYLQLKKEGYHITTVDKVLANFRMGGASNQKNIKKAIGRIRDRYQWCYRINGYSRLYLLECIAMEAAKMLLS